MTFNTLIGLTIGICLFSCAAALLAMWFGIAAKPERFRTAFALSGLALAAGYAGISRFHFAASKTVNGHVQWSFNSKWFFLGALVLGAISLTATLWRYCRRRLNVSRPLQP